jgi:hypothetical protein
VVRGESNRLQTHSSVHRAVQFAETTRCHTLRLYPGHRILCIGIKTRMIQKPPALQLRDDATKFIRQFRITVLATATIPTTTNQLIQRNNTLTYHRRIRQVSSQLPITLAKPVVFPTSNSSNSKAGLFMAFMQRRGTYSKFVCS